MNDELEFRQTVALEQILKELRDIKVILRDNCF